MNRLSVVFAFITSLMFPIAAQAQTPGCQFVLGFSAMAAAVPQVGACKEDQHFAPNGDAQQLTAGGLLVWRKADNWTAFTDGYRTWLNGPNGIQQRLNTETFPWETATSTPASSPATPSSTATTGPIDAAWVKAEATKFMDLTGGKLVFTWPGDTQAGILGSSRVGMVGKTTVVTFIFSQRAGAGFVGWDAVSHDARLATLDTMMTDAETRLGPGHDIIITTENTFEYASPIATSDCIDQDSFLNVDPANPAHIGFHTVFNNGTISNSNDTKRAVRCLA